MTKVRVYELAKKIGVSNKEVIGELARLGVSVKTHASSIEGDIAKKLEGIFRTREKSQPKAEPGVRAGAKKAAPARIEKPEAKAGVKKEPKK